MRILRAVHVAPLAHVGLKMRRTEDARSGGDPVDTGKELLKGTSIGGLAFG